MSAVLSLIETIERTRRCLLREPRRRAQLQALQCWQVQRLRRTYADYALHPRYRDAFDFFIHDLYGPYDFTSRDRNLERVLRQWQRLLPQRALQAVEAALELEALTQTLDLAVVDALGAARPDAMSYPAAYRQANRREQRQRQIWLILSAGRALDELVHLPAIGMALRMARLPARLTGVTVLHEFLERGHAAFAKMSGAHELLRAIEQRETAIMQRLFAGHPDPFGLHAPALTAGTC